MDFGTKLGLTLAFAALTVALAAWVVPDFFRDRSALGGAALFAALILVVCAVGIWWIPNPVDGNAVPLFRSSGGEISGNEVTIKSSNGLPGLVESLNTKVLQNKFNLDIGINPLPIAGGLLAVLILIVCLFLWPVRPHRDESVTLIRSSGGEVSGSDLTVRTSGRAPGLIDGQNTRVKQNKFDVEAGAKLPPGVVQVRGKIGYIGRPRTNVTANGDVKMVEGTRYPEGNGQFRETGYLFIENGLTAKKAVIKIQAHSLIYCDLLLHEPGHTYRTLNTTIKEGAAVFDIDGVVPDMYHVNMKLTDPKEPWHVEFEIAEK